MYWKYFFKQGDKHYVIAYLREFFYNREYLEPPEIKMSSLLFDAQVAKMLTEYKEYWKLDKSEPEDFLTTLSGESLLDIETYQQIGSEMSKSEIDRISLYDADVKRLLYGIAGIDVYDNWNTIAPVIPKDKFVGWGYEGVTENCFSYCQKQLSMVGKSMKSNNWGTNAKINPYIYQIYLTENVAGMEKGDQPKAFIDGVIYIKNALVAGKPVVVGVEDGPGSPNRDKVTDHFVTIVGMGTDGTGKYFLFYDNATSARDSGTSDQNKLYCNSDKFEIRGTGPNAYIQSTEYQYYIVTQIRETN